MITGYHLFRPLLFALEAEDAHLAVQNAARLFMATRVLPALARRYYTVTSPRLTTNVFDIEFPSPIGMAAGFDKNAEFVDFLESLGFGFAEVGSVTFLPCAGNPRPRLFRLPKDRALLNRFGLNNVGPTKLVTNLDRQRLNIPVGISIAKTNRADILDDRAVQDMVACYQSVSYAADYSVLNVSSPTTKDGKTFEDPDRLRALLSELMEARAHIDTHEPVLVKFSADISLSCIDRAIEICESFNIRGYVLCNTSLSQECLRTPTSRLTRFGLGGISGKPLRNSVLERVRFVFRKVGRRKPIIGVGGIDSAESAYELICAGASLVQLYTGLIYRGPSLVRTINNGLLRYLDRDGFLHIREAVGVRSEI